MKAYSVQQNGPNINFFKSKLNSNYLKWGESREIKASSRKRLQLENKKHEKIHAGCCMLKISLSFIIFHSVPFTPTLFSFSVSFFFFFAFICFHIKAGLKQAQSFSVFKYGLQLYAKFVDTSPKTWLETTALLKQFCILHKPAYCNAPKPRTPDFQPAQVSGTASVMHFKVWIFVEYFC